MLQLHGKGDQIFVCGKVGDGFAWRLKAPDATLVGADGAVAGHHFGGPTWRANDGSEVVGKVIAAGSTAGADAAPWLILQAVSHAGSGLFAAVSYVVRSNTEGGATPDRGCDASHAGEERRVAYTADYMFFGVR